MIPYHHQWLAALTLSLGSMISGTTEGWTPPYMAKLTAPDCTHRLKLTYSEASWVASDVYIGRLIGAIFGATIQEFIGRKKTLLCICGPMAIGWTLIIVGPTVSWLYASRIFTGMSVGMMFTASASFVGEIADPMIRGSLITLIPYGIVCGGLVGSIMGGLVSLETFSYVCLALTGLFFVVFMFIPESPYYHIANGDLQKAEESLQWYKKDADVTREIYELRAMIGNTDVNMSRTFNEFKKPENRNNFLLLFILTMFPYCAGMNSTDAYAEIILTNGKVDFTPSVVVMVLTLISNIACMVPILLVDKFGRRTLLIGSGLGVTMGHVLLGFHFHMLSSGVDPKSINLLPVFSLFLIYFSLPSGLSSVRYSLIGELFPPILKTPASLIFTASSAIASFGVLKCFQSYMDLVGQKYVFWTFAIVAISSVVFSFFCIPETTRMKLSEIQKNLKKNIKENNVTAAHVELLSVETSKTLPDSKTYFK